MNILKRLTEKAQKFERLKSQLPRILGQLTVSHFQSNFSLQGFEGNKWKEVNRRIPGTPEFKYPKNKGLGRRTKAILSGKTGALRRDIRLGKVSFSKTEVVNSLPYAAAQNRGTRRITKRKFMGGSEALNKKINRKIAYLMKSI